MTSILAIEEIRGIDNNGIKEIKITDGHSLNSEFIKTNEIEFNSIKNYNSDNLLTYDASSNTVTLNDNFKLEGVNSNSIVYPGATVQRKMRMIKTDFDYPTGGGYYQNFAHATCFRTKITTKENNSALFVRMGLNGEGNATHDWSMYPVRSFVDTTTMNVVDWNHNVARHLNDGENPSTQFEYYIFSYTNPGNYPDGNYDSTPIQTATMEFIDTPNVSAGTDIWYSLILMYTGSNTFYVNRSVNASVGGAYERGVSYVYIEEVAGPVQITNVQSGIIEYTF